MDERTICCRGGGTLAASRRAIDALPPDSPLALMLNGSSSLAGGCAVDAELHALRVIFDWLEQGCEPSSSAVSYSEVRLRTCSRRPIICFSRSSAGQCSERCSRQGCLMRGMCARAAAVPLTPSPRSSTLAAGRPASACSTATAATRCAPSAKPRGDLAFRRRRLRGTACPAPSSSQRRACIAMSTRSSAASVAAAGRRRPDGVRGERMAAADRPRKQAGDGERVGNPQITPALVSSACCFVSKLHRSRISNVHAQTSSCGATTVVSTRASRSRTACCPLPPSGSASETTSCSDSSSRTTSSMPLRGRGGEGGRRGRWGLDSLGRSDPLRRAPAAPHPAACSSQSSARSLHGAPLGERQLNGHCTRAHIIESGIGPGTDSGLVCAWERAWARRNPRRRRGERATPPPSSAAAPAAPRSAATPARGRAARSARNGPRRRRSERRTSARRGAAAATAARIRATRRPQKCARCARRPRAPPRTAAYGAHSRARAAATGHPRRHPAAPSPAQRRTNHPIAHAVNHLYPPVSSPCDLA